MVTYHCVVPEHPRQAQAVMVSCTCEAVVAALAVKQPAKTQQTVDMGGVVLLSNRISE